MCGIGLVLLRKISHESTYKAALEASLAGRGPDGISTVSIEGHPFSEHSLLLSASILHMRGPSPTYQPLSLPGGSYLCFNGEIWAGLKGLTSNGSDTVALGEALYAALDGLESGSARAGAVHGIISALVGPFSFLLWDNVGECLYMGKDGQGRRSLVWSAVGDKEGEGASLTSPLFISSRGLRLEGERLLSCEEIPPAGLYTLSKRGSNTGGGLGVVQRWCEVGGWEISLLPWGPSGAASSAPARTSPLPTPAPSTISSHDLAPTIEALLTTLSEAVRVRVVSGGGEEEVESPTDPPPARIAILFSGGLDCMVLAVLTHRHLPPWETIDLINVDFSAARNSPDRLSALDGVAELRRVCPGRGFNLLCVDETYANVIQGEALEATRCAVHPQGTHLDFNLAFVLGAAARGVGYIHPGSSTEEGQRGSTLPAATTTVTTAARVFLSGLGADEVFGGYGRHRSVFLRGGWEGLERELGEDVGRLWVRNLGRDDRVIAAHGREARWPYLDERVLGFAAAEPLCVLCDHRLPPGEGDKRLLRLAAHSLGLANAASRVKRAMHFGSRVAKCSDELMGGGGVKADTPFSL